MIGPGTLDWMPALDRPDLLAPAVLAALRPWAAAPSVLVAPIEAEASDTAVFGERYGVPLADSANCVVIAGKWGSQVRHAACLVLADSRVDVNGMVRRRLDARKASFAPTADATQLTGMEYGGITPLGLPAEWPLLVDPAVLRREVVVIGSGVRHSKIAINPGLLDSLPGAEVLDGLAG